MVYVELYKHVQYRISKHQFGVQLIYFPIYIYISDIFTLQLFSGNYKDLFICQNSIETCHLLVENIYKFKIS